MTDAEIAISREIVKALAYRYDRPVPACRRDDLVGVGLEAAVLACRDFDGRGILTAYIVQRVRRAMLDYLRRHYRSRGGEWRCMVSQGDRDDPLVWDPDPAIHLDVERTLQRLDARSRRVVERVDLAGEPAVDVARDLGVTSARITQLRKAAFARMAS